MLRVPNTFLVSKSSIHYYIIIQIRLIKCMYFSSGTHPIPGVPLQPHSLTDTAEEDNRFSKRWRRQTEEKPRGRQINLYQATWQTWFPHETEPHGKLPSSMNSMSMGYKRGAFHSLASPPTGSSICMDKIRLIEAIIMGRMDRKSSIETEPRTLKMNQIQFARVSMEGLMIACVCVFLVWVRLSDEQWFCDELQEAALYVMNTTSMEEAIKIFTEVISYTNFAINHYQIPY